MPSIVMLGLGKPPARKSGPPPKFGAPDKGADVSPAKKAMAKYESDNAAPMDEEKNPDAGKIDTLAKMAEHMGLDYVADEIRKCGHEQNETPAEEATEEDALAG